MTTPTREQVVQWIATVGLDGIKNPDNVARFELLAETAFAAGQLSARADLEAIIKEQAAEIAELQRWRTSGIERSAKDSDLVSLYRQQLAAAQLHIEQLRGAMLMMLCDSEGKCCMAGSDEDRFIIDTALSTQPDLSALEAERQRVAEACAKVCDQQKDECGTGTDCWYGAKWCEEAIRAGQWKDY